MQCKKCQHNNSPFHFLCEECGEELIANYQNDHLSTTFVTNDNDSLEQQQKTYFLDDDKTNSNHSSLGFNKNITHEKNNSPLEQSSNNHYQILKKIGEGAMGIVYQAKDIQLDRLIAIKVFRNEYVSEKNREKMLDEARLTSALNHPNVITIYDVSRDKDNCFINMEWINGKTLDQYLPSVKPERTKSELNKSEVTKSEVTKSDPVKKPLSLKQKLSYARQIASGVNAAHQENIIHRDLKPNNIIIQKSYPEVKILDFGIAEITKPLDDEELNLKPEYSAGENKKKDDKIANKGLKGTICYMSPEQSQGQTLSLSSDIFSFGIILYQMFYGSHPFLKDQAKDTLKAICDETPDYLINQNIQSVSNKNPNELKKLIERCLSKTVNERPESMLSIEKTLISLEEQEKNRILNRGWRYWFTPLRLVSLVILMTAAIFIIPKLLDYKISTSRASVLLQGNTVALLPFENVSGDPALDIFAQGFSISLSNDLAMVGQENKDTWVIPATELRKLKDKSIEAVYKKYNPELIITGSIQHLGNIRRLTISILNAKDSKLLHSIVHDMPANEVFKWQGIIRDSILKVLGWNVSNNIAEQFNKPITTGSQAYQAYLQGLSYLYRYDYKNNLDNAIESFTKAVEIDPSFIEATRELTRAYIRASKVRRSGGWIKHAETYALKTMGISPNHSTSYSLMADVFYAKSDYLQAKKYYLIAIEKSLNNASAYIGLANIYKRDGDLNSAEKTYKRSLAVNDNWISWNYLAVFYYKTNQLDKAEAAYSQLQALTPNNDFASQVNGAIKMSQRDYSTAEEIFHQALKIAPNANNYSNLGTAQFYQQKYAQSVSSFSLATSLAPDNYVLWYNLGDGFRWLKQAGKARGSYNKAIELLNYQILRKPNLKKYKVDRALLLAKQGKTKKAVLEIYNLTNINDSYQMISIAQIFLFDKRMEESVKWLNKAIDLGYSLESLYDEPELQTIFSSKWQACLSAKKQTCN